MIMINRSLPVVLGIDAGLKRDSAAIAVCSWESSLQKVRLVSHRIFTPSPDRPLDLEETLEAAIRDYHRRFALREARYDPWQMARSAQGLVKAGVPMREFPMSVPNLTAATSNLFELLKAGALLAYPDPDIRLAIQRCVVVESSRGVRLSKERASHKIDIIVALSIAALAAVEVLSDEGGFDISAASAAIVAVARTGFDGVKHVVGSLLSPEAAEPVSVAATREPDAIIRHDGVINPRTGKPADPHPASATCGICRQEQLDSVVRGGASFPVAAVSGMVMRTVGRLGTEILDDDAAARAAQRGDPVLCGFCHTVVSGPGTAPHRARCPEAYLLAPGEATCANCRHPRPGGHEADCVFGDAFLANPRDQGGW